MHGKSSYYYQRAAIKRPDKYREIHTNIIELFKENRNCYGYRRIHSELKKIGIGISEKIVRRIMKAEKLTVPTKRTRKYSSYKGEITPEVDNIINRNFHADEPNKKWLTDITEFAIPAGKVYLSPIIDCFDGMVVYLNKKILVFRKREIYIIITERRNLMRYVTKGVMTTLPVGLQWLLWGMIDSMPVEKDYLQVFELSVCNGRQKVVHKQEVPEYKREYFLNTNDPVSGKVFVIDGVMMMNYEY